LVVNHDLGKAITHFDDLILLNTELIASGSRTSVLSEENMNRAYRGQVLPLRGSGLMLSALIEPLQYSFMQRSLVIALLVGNHLRHRWWLLDGAATFARDAISHSVLPGLAIAFILGLISCRCIYCWYSQHACDYFDSHAIAD